MFGSDGPDDPYWWYFESRRLNPRYDQSEEDKKGGHGFELDPAVFHLVLLCTVTVCIVSVKQAKVAQKLIFLTKVSLVFLVTCIYIKYKGKELHRKR